MTTKERAIKYMYACAAQKDKKSGWSIGHSNQNSDNWMHFIPIPAHAKIRMQQGTELAGVVGFRSEGLMKCNYRMNRDSALCPQNRTGEWMDRKLMWQWRDNEINKLRDVHATRTETMTESDSRKAPVVPAEFETIL